MKKIEGVNVAVVGATGDIGGTLAKHFVEMGANVFAIGRNKERLGALKLLEPKLTTLALESSLVADMEDLVSSTKPDILVTSVGKWEMVDADFDPENFAHQLKKDFAAFVEAATVPMFVFNQYFRKKGNGTMVDVSSHAAEGFLPGNLTYAPVKAAVKAFMDNLRGENGHNSGVKILRAISQLVDTPKNRSAFPNFTEEEWRTAVQIGDIAEWIADSFTKSNPELKRFFKSGIIL